MIWVIVQLVILAVMLFAVRRYVRTILRARKDIEALLEATQTERVRADEAYQATRDLLQGWSTRKSSSEKSEDV